MNTTELKSILDTMDVPEQRKDISKNTNVEWLLRNLFIRNCDHDWFDEVITELRVIWSYEVK
jgi:hypothetical protein